MRLCSHVSTSLRQNKTGQSTRYVMFPRYACVRVLEEMKSLQHSCHDLAVMQNTTNIENERRRREKSGGG